MSAMVCSTEDHERWKQIPAWWRDQRLMGLQASPRSGRVWEMRNCLACDSTLAKEVIVPARVEDREENFWSKVAIGDGCWEWRGAIGSSGYGNYWYLGQVMHASRAAWLIHRGPLPADVHVCHRCDNRRCVRPSHLFAGTRSDNMRDMVSKGRANSRLPEPRRGVANPMARLTDDQVSSLRARKAAGATCRELAAEFGICPMTVSRVARGLRYSEQVIR